MRPSLITLVGKREIWTYTLEDLVQGRVVRDLEGREIDIRVITAIVRALRVEGHRRPLSSLSWATAGQDIYVGYPDGNWVEGRHPGQQVIPEVLNLNRIRAEARTAIRRPEAFAGQVERRRGALGSKQVFAGTRIPLAAIRPYVERGYPDERILEAFPDLRPADVAAGRAHLAKLA